MLKKILISLLILIVVIAGGIISLVVFVDPNNFKGFISSTVKDKTGYELSINGDLRWHIWPQISILTDSVKLEDTGAKEPILTADNMRLDVELMPLFSKELVVKNVLIKAAVINLTDQSKGETAKQTKPKATIDQKPVQSAQPKQDSDSRWTFELSKLDIIDSTVVYQQDKDIISFRDTNVGITQQSDKNVQLELNGVVNRDLQDFTYSLKANVDLTHFPDNASVAVSALNYSYKGTDVPTGELSGTLKATFAYQRSPFTLSSDDFLFSLNGNYLLGTLKANLDKKPYFEAKFQSEKFDLTPFLGEDANKKVEDKEVTRSAPVVSTPLQKGNELAFLQNFDAKFALAIDKVLAKDVVIDNFVIEADNKNGVAKLNKVGLNLAKGSIDASGVANGKQPTVSVKLDTIAKDINLGVLLTQLRLANNFNGLLNAQGHVSTTTLNPQNIMKSVAGDLELKVTNARLENLNIQNIIQSGVERYTKEPVSDEKYQQFTEFSEISAQANLSQGDMNLNSIKALSASLDVIGSGKVGLVNQDLDLDLQVKVLSGWNDKSQTIQKLQKVAIPLRIYGTFDALHYQLNADKLLKDLFSNKIQNELDKLKERLNKDKETTTDENSSETKNSSDKEKVKELLGGLINKIN